MIEQVIERVKIPALHRADKSRWSVRTVNGKITHVYLDDSPPIPVDFFKPVFVASLNEQLNQSRSS